MVKIMFVIEKLEVRPIVASVTELRFRDQNFLVAGRAG